MIRTHEATEVLGNGTAREFPVGAPWADAVRRAAGQLYEAGATAVWLFGSRARTRPPDRLADFDLGVEGLRRRSGAIHRATGELWGRVDIVCLEWASAAIRQAILRDRILVPRVACAPAPRGRRRLPLPDSLAGRRTRAVADAIREVTPGAVMDFGCGRGWLLAELAADAAFDRLTGVDFDGDALEAARRRIARTFAAFGRDGAKLLTGLITHRDPAFLGHDAAAAVEVIEHLDREPLAAFIGVVFGYVRPRRAVITTPNAEYNQVWNRPGSSRLRHPDHRFEWTRGEFTTWAGNVAATYGYKVNIKPIGTPHPSLGPPTQMAVFDRMS
jgi:SAM-dependent methyltransferase